MLNDEDDAELTPKQAEAYSNAMEEGADEGWVPADEVGSQKTIDALVMKHVFQDAKNEIGRRYIAVDGLMLGDPPTDSTPAEEVSDDLSNLAGALSGDDEGGE